MKTRNSKGKCLICKEPTINKLNSHRICIVCIDKFGDWESIKKKLKSLNINCRIKEENQIEPKKPLNTLK